jgi:hypothetical protein
LKNLFEWFYIDESTCDLKQYRFGWKFTIFKLVQYLLVFLGITQPVPVEVRYPAIVLATILVIFNILMFYSIGLSNFRRKMKGWKSKGHFLKGNYVVEKSISLNS